MKEIKERHLVEFDTEKYQKIVDGIYLNKKAKNFCFAYECILEEGENQYPLEDLLDNFYVNCVDYYGDEIEEDGVKKSIVEVETLDDKKKSLLRILAYSTIVGKTINNVILNGGVCVGSLLGNGKIIFEGKEYTLPVYVIRDGEESFEAQQWEYHFLRNFSSIVDMDKHGGHSAIDADDKLKNILLMGRQAYITFINDSNKESIKYKSIVLKESELDIK